jgi:hypothetical protein
MNILKEPVALLHDLAAQRAVKQFAAKYGFVYFGKVDHREDEHTLVRGLTASAEHSDNHYAVGNFKGHDITLVERRNTLRYPGKQPEPYRWQIMQIDLRRDDLSHIFIDAHHHEEVFYANLFVKFGNFEDASRLFIQYDPLFLKYFKVFAVPDNFEDVVDIITPELAMTLGHHFRQFDFEFDGDQLLVYASNTVITSHVLGEMLRAGLWLTEQLNAQRSQYTVKA